MSASIFNGDAVKILKDKLRFKNGAEFSASQAANAVSNASTSTTNALARFDSTSGKTITNSSVLLDNSGNITGVQSLSLLADAVSSLQAVTKQQLDAAINGVQRKHSVKAASTADLTLSGEQTIDGVSLVSGDRVLVKDQSTLSQNGIYIVSTGTWSRSADANSPSNITHAIVSVQSGSVNANRAYEQITDNPVLGTDPIEWIQTYGSGTYTADGQGIELTGATFNLELDGTTLSKSSSGLKVNQILNSEISVVAAIQFSKMETLTANRAPVLNASGIITASSVTSTELGHLSGVTSAIQTQIDSKQNTITGGATTITTSNLTANRAVVSDGSGKVATSTVTSTEIGHLSGVTSGIQAQIDSKQNTITGAATSITSVDLTADRALISNGSGKVAASSVSNTELGYLSGATSNLQTQIDSKQANITGAATTIVSSDLTSNRVVVSTIAGKIAVASASDTEVDHLTGVTSNIQTQLNGKQDTITGAATSVTTANLTSGVVVVSDGAGKISASGVFNSELGYLSGVTSNVQTQIDSKQATITGAATSITSADLTADRVLLSNGSGKVAASSVSNIELGYLSGVTSNIQTQIDSKEPTITGAATSITSADLTADRALISNGSGKVAASSVSNTELGHLAGVTSAIQTQIDSKANASLDNILPAAAVNFNSQKLSSVADPTSAQDAATKNYVDSIVSNPFNLSYVDDTSPLLGNRTYLVNTRAAVITLTLPSSSLNRYVIVKDAVGLNSQYNVIIDTPGSQLIDGQTSYTCISDWESVMFVCDGTNWFII